MSIKPLYIYGAGGLGKEVASLVYEINRINPQWELKGFFDDAWPSKTECLDLPVVGDFSKLMDWKDEIALVVAIGNPVVKRRVAERLSGGKISFPVLIHPSVIIYNRDRVDIGAGSVLGAGVILTTDIQIGAHVLLNLNVTVGHDCLISDYVSVMPGVNLAGGIEMERAVFIGSGANVVNAVHLGESSRIGAGAVVLHDVKAGETVVGIPAKTVNSVKNGKTTTDY